MGKLALIGATLLGFHGHAACHYHLAVTGGQQPNTPIVLAVSNTCDPPGSGYIHKRVGTFNLRQPLPKLGQTVTLTAETPEGSATASCPPGQHLAEMSYGVGNDVRLSNIYWDPQRTYLAVNAHLAAGWPYGTFYYWIRCA